MAKIFIKPNPNVNPLVGFATLEQRTVKRDSQGVETTERENITKRYTRAPGTSQRFCANPSRKLHGNLNHGMLDVVTNPYKEDTIFSDPNLERILKGKDTAMKQHIMEHKWGKPFNYWTNQVVDPMEVEAKDLPALMKAEYTIELNDGVTVLDTTTEFGDVMYCILVANEQIANSYEEMNSKTPFYIAKEEEEAERKQQREAIQDRCLAYLIDLFDNHKKALFDFCKALDIRKRPTSDNSAYNELKSFIKRSKDNAEFFKKMYNMWSDETTKPSFTARVMLYDARENGFILKDGPSYTWYPPTSEEGEPRESITFDRFTGSNSVIEFLSHPKYQNEQAMLLEQISRANKYTK